MTNLSQLAALLTLSFLLSGCDPCGNEISQSVFSPSGKLKAVVFNRNCGATTGFNTQVSITAASEVLPADGGNTLILKGQVPLKVVWNSDSAVRLTGLGAATVYKKESAAAGVAITYGN